MLVTPKHDPKIYFIWFKENPHIPYNCKSSPILYASSVQQFGYKLPYDGYYGGVLGVNLQHFLAVNGYPNRFKKILISTL
jgi:hypothetical protein